MIAGRSVRVKNKNKKRCGTAAMILLQNLRHQSFGRLFFITVRTLGRYFDLLTFACSGKFFQTCRSNCPNSSFWLWHFQSPTHCRLSILLKDNSTRSHGGRGWIPRPAGSGDGSNYQRAMRPPHEERPNVDSGMIVLVKPGGGKKKTAATCKVLELEEKRDNVYVSFHLPDAEEFGEPDELAKV